jgi:GPH family glycoside/pentoside/hexuronide:cation symporter
VLGVAIATASLVLFAAKIWDWVANPLMGLISDRTHTRWGRRRPYLILGGVVSGFAFAVFFSAALTPVSQSLLLVTLSLALVGTGYTIFNVPYMAMPSELVDDYKERTRMISVRVFCIGIGTMIGISTQRLAEILGGDAEGYAQMGLIIGVFVFFFMALTFFGTAGGRQHARETQRVPLAEQLRTGFANKPFAALLGTKFTQLFGLFTSTAMSIFVVKYVLGKENPGEWMIYFTAVSFVGQTLSIPMWTWITNKIEKRAAYMLSTAAFCLMSLTGWWRVPKNRSTSSCCARCSRVLRRVVCCCSVNRCCRTPSSMTTGVPACVVRACSRVCTAWWKRWPRASRQRCSALVMPGSVSSRRRRCKPPKRSTVSATVRRSYRVSISGFR